jgi:hypothetical protein
MTRRRVLCGLMLGSAVLACVGGWLVVRPRSMQSRFEQVRKGMPLEEVIRTVGAPPGNYSSIEITITPSDEGTWQSWFCDDVTPLVQFGDTDQPIDAATRVEIVDTDLSWVRRPPTLSARNRRRGRRRWIEPGR